MRVLIGGVGGGSRKSGQVSFSLGRHYLGRKMTTRFRSFAARWLRAGIYMRSSVRRNGAIRRICGAEGALQSSSAICLFVLSEQPTKFVL